MLAGEPVSLQGMLTIQAVSVAAGVFVAFAGLTAGGPPLRLIGVAALGLVLAVMPLYWLRIRVSARKRSLLKALPDAVDLIVTTVEAGLGLDAALSEVGHETQGPLGEELRLTVRETTLGRSRRDALTRLIERTDVPELKTFVQAIIQAEQTGIPVGQVLRTQAAQIRLKKRQRAEAEAQRAPVKMVVVLALLVLPAMLLMIIGPAGIRMTEQF
jgi:tight adherence protein C